MVFPSPACATCKKRRIKCDTVRPTCNRCSSADRRCIWTSTTEASGLSFRIENAYAKGEARRPRKALSVNSPQFFDTPIPPTLLETNETHALNFWMQNWTGKPSDVPDIGREYLTYVPSYWKSSSEDSALRLAVSALSLTVFGRVHNVVGAIAQGETYYAKVIRKTQSDIQDLDHADTDALVLATMLMTHYEIRAAILRGVNVQGWLKDATLFGEEGPVLRLDALMVRVADLRAKALQLQNLDITTRNNASWAMFFESQLLNLELSSWRQTTTDDFKLSNFSFTQFSQDGPLWPCSITYGYRSYSHAAIWIRYYAVCMIAHSLILRMITGLDQHRVQVPHLTEQLRRSTTAIHELATEICCSIPYFFNFSLPSNDSLTPKVVTHLAWPLAVGISVEAVPEDRKYWFRHTLATIATALGDGVLECIARGEEFDI
ncbi:uncharacterized protein JN550_012501 [Neoarthrinium moseri]|uniref:uncharacterized protein n=1 Tax=Neoarthrinium moseri TaxID=1658444 RepID=UPI001FDB9364|nr:uncharacterized protein JN550_012501 [Neoarthrinium moseri]KAI1858751.1 hypothetical protein JN550_012501 [Neoarthrinium moseri]